MVNESHSVRLIEFSRAGSERALELERHRDLRVRRGREHVVAPEVEVDGPRRITAHVDAGRERNFMRVLVGDRVVVTLTARDMTRGRIVRKV